MGKELSLAENITQTLNASRKANAVKVFSGDDDVFHRSFLPCGLESIDYILGGGFALGRAVEIFGNWSSGKTYVLYKALAACQQAGGTAILLEAEGAFDKEFFRAVGGNPDDLILIPVRTVEQVFDCAMKIAKLAVDKPDDIVVVGWDSIAMTGTEHLVEVGMDKRDMSKSNLMSQGAQLVGTLIADSKTCFIATNQTRVAIGSKDSATHTPGGNAWGFYASQRLELRFDGGSKGSLINEVVKVAGKTGQGDELGRWIRADVVKNKCGPPHLKCSLPFYNFANYEHPEFGYPTKEGVDRVEALFDLFTESRYYVVNTPTQKERVVQSPSQGWYSLHPMLDTSGQKFRKADWPKILESKPLLWKLPYMRMQTDGAGESAAGTNNGVPIPPPPAPAV